MLRHPTLARSRLDSRAAWSFRLVALIAISQSCLLLLSSPAHASDEDYVEEAQAFIELGFRSAIPSGDLAEEIDHAAYGLEALFGVRVSGSPVHLGLEIGWYRFGVGDNRDALGLTNETLTDNTFTGHLLMRYQPRWWRLRPYAEGMVGFRYLLATRSRGGSVTFDQSDAVASWGVGAGLDFLLTSLARFERQGAGIGLTLGFRYLWGSEAEYFVVDEGPDRAAFTSRRSSTNVMMPYVGFTAHF